MIEDNRTSVTVPATLDGNDFLRFALFDTFHMKKKWKLPVLFICIMSVSALLCFSFQRSNNQAVFLGTVLLGIGLLLPLVWFLLYLSSVRKEAKKLRLSREKSQYDTQLGESGVSVVRGDEHAEWLWQDVYTACRVRSCIYLYVQPGRAFLLPKDENADLAWEIICRSLPEQKRKDLR